MYINDQLLTLYSKSHSYGICLFSKNEVQEIFVNADKVQPSASIIKLFIMYFAYNQNAKVDKSTYDIIYLMITESDNDATNALIDLYGMDKVNEFIQNKGFTDTILRRKMLDFETRARGIDNMTSVRDVMKFLTCLYKSRNHPPYSEMLSIMKDQQIKTKIHLYMPSDVIIASKTGELDDVENDVGIIFSKTSEHPDIVIAVFSDGVTDGEKACDTIGQFVKSVYDAAKMPHTSTH